MSLREALRTAPGVVRAQSGLGRKVAVVVLGAMALAGYCLMVPLFEAEKRGWWKERI